MAGPGYPSPTNTFVPNHAASQSLVVGYSRSPGTFRVSQYSQYINALNPVGMYFVWTSQQAARILTNDDAEHLWQDGDAAPAGANNLESGEWQSFFTKRYAYPFLLGAIAVENASYRLLAMQAAVSAQQAMTARTMLVQNNLANASWGQNTAAVDGGILPSGHNWTTGNDGTGTNQGPNIKKSLQYGEKIVNQLTIGVVQPSMLTLVVNPTTAQAMAASTEIQDYIKQSPFALAQLRGDVPSQNGKWGLPDILYNHPVAVEDAVRITSRKGASSTTYTYCLADGSAYLLARQGELEGIEGERSYSTVQIFFYRDELTVYTKFDADNERYMGRVVQNYSPVVVSTLSGFYFTNCLG